MDEIQVLAMELAKDVLVVAVFTGVMWAWLILGFKALDYVMEKW